MTIFYSGKTRGFYDSALHGENIPDGAVEIEQEDYEALLAGQCVGKTIAPDVKGRPILLEPPARTLDSSFAALAGAVDRHMDGVVKTRDYTNGIDRALTWMFSVDPKVAAEAQAMARWRDAVWAKFYVFKDAAATSGLIPSEAELLAGLPVMEWPSA